MPKAVKIDDFVFTNLQSLDEVNALKAELAKPEYDGLSDKDALHALTVRPQIANPESAAQVPDPAKLNVGNLLGKLTQQEILDIPDDSLNRVGDHIKAMEVQDCIYACAIWEAKGYINTAKKNELLAEITATIDDPRHKATIPGDSKLTQALGRDPGGLSIKELQKAKEV